MIFKLLKFHFNTPLHIGTVREEYSHSGKKVHSDMLYAAIMQAWSVLGMSSLLSDIGKKEDETGNLSFTLSSLFPFTQEKQLASELARNQNAKKTIYFLPRIFKSFSKETILTAKRQNKTKRLKELEWFDLDYFSKLVSDPNDLAIDLDHISGKYLSQLNFDPNFLNNGIQARAAIPRKHGDANPYYVERLYFENGSGMFGLYKGTAETWKHIEAALHYLQYEGIGTDRHVGNGKFQLEVLDHHTEEVMSFTNLLNREEGYCTNLSLYSPDSQQKLEAYLSGSKVGYNLIKRGGWITTEPFMTLRKKSLFMFTEGSIFSRPTSSSNNTGGKIINIRPETDDFRPISHPIWRVGKSLLVPVNL